MHSYSKLYELKVNENVIHFLPQMLLLMTDKACISDIL